MRRSQDKSAGAAISFEASMSVALGLGLGFFVLTAVASVLAVGLISGYHNTVDLLRQKAELLVVSEVNTTRFYLESARDQVDFVADQVKRGEVVPDTGEEFLALLMGALAATPQIISLQYIGKDYQLIGAERKEMQTSPFFLSIKGDSDLKGLFDQVRKAAVPTWGAVLWREEYGEASLNYHRPIIRDGEFVGIVSALISLRRLSELISDLETDFGANAFILYGKDQVLAHPMLAFGYPGLSRTLPLPRQESFVDPVLVAMWAEQPKGFFFDEAAMAGPGRRFVRFGDDSFIILYRELEEYSDRPLIVGTHLPALDIMSEIYRLRWAIILCLIISAVSAITAATIGRKIAVPVRRLADGAKKVHDLELASVERIPGSFFRELNDAASSFNAMLDGLRWFERYVPKALVRQFISDDGDTALASQYREVAIMFTDIENFTTLTENMTAPAVAEFVNQHFTMLTTCVEAEGGTIDKYIGDTMMAIWGAPEVAADPADRAGRAALAIQQAVHQHNKEHVETDGGRLRLRIGLHVGRVMAGNIGSPGRINYTVVGDPVNVTERLEELGKDIGRTRDDVNILVSGAFRSALLASFDLTHIGPKQLRGRAQTVEVYVLNGPGAATAAG